MKPATGNSLHISIPTKLSQLTPGQIKFIAMLYLLHYSRPEYLTKALLKITGLKIVREVKNEPGAYWFQHPQRRKPFILDADQLAAMLKQVAFLLEPDELHPLKWIGMARARHFRLYNATFDEYLMAENYYFAFVETKDHRHLENLMACLYRRPWQKWDANKIQTRAKRFRNINPEVKFTVFLWYIGFRAFVPKRCKSLFSGGKPKTAFHPRNYINGMIHQLSNGNITLKDKLLSRPMWDALDELEQRAIELDALTSRG